MSAWAWSVALVCMFVLGFIYGYFIALFRVIRANRRPVPPAWSNRIGNYQQRGGA